MNGGDGSGPGFEGKRFDFMHTETNIATNVSTIPIHCL